MSKSVSPSQKKQLSQLLCGLIRPMWETMFYSFQKTSERDERGHLPTLLGLREEKH